MDFCPFIKDECHPDCVFRCRPRAASESMDHAQLRCVIASRLDAINTEQRDQLSELINAVTSLD